MVQGPRVVGTMVCLPGRALQSANDTRAVCDVSAMHEPQRAAGRADKASVVDMWTPFRQVVHACVGCGFFGVLSRLPAVSIAGRARHDPDPRQGSSAGAHHLSIHPRHAERNPDAAANGRARVG